MTKAGEIKVMTKAGESNPLTQLLSWFTDRLWCILVSRIAPRSRTYRCVFPSHWTGIAQCQVIFSVIFWTFSVIRYL